MAKTFGIASPQNTSGEWQKNSAIDVYQDGLDGY